MNKTFNWKFDFDPLFPAHFFKYSAEPKDPVHWHQYIEIGLCIKGKGVFNCSCKQYPVNTGDIFVTNNYQQHVALPSNGEQLQFILLIFLPSYISVNNYAAGKYIETFRYNPPDFENKIEGGTKEAKSISGLIRKGYRYYSDKQNAWEINVDIIIRNILAKLYFHYRVEQMEHVMPEDYTINSKVAIAKQYIIQHSTEPISLQEVADYVDLNATYFRHLFKKVMHISFQEYVTNIRISNVCKLLVSSDRNISEIIHSVGFSNSSQFYHTFFEYYQMTPAEYRRTSGTRRTKLET